MSARLICILDFVFAETSTVGWAAWLAACWPYPISISDRFGNRTAVVASNNTGSPVTADGWQSLTFDPASNRITSTGFVYDTAGNQLQNNTGQAFLYDAAGRLAKVKNLSGTTLATYTYGASNRRLITQTGSEASTDKTYYIWEGNSVIAEYVEQTSATMPKWSKSYIYRRATPCY